MTPVAVHAKACVFVTHLAGASADIRYDSRQPWEIRIDSVYAALVIPRWMLDSGRTKHVRSGDNRLACFPCAKPKGYTTYREQATDSALQVTIRTSTLDEFLRATYLVVPAGDEDLHQQYPTADEWDAWLREVAPSDAGGAA